MIEKIEYWLIYHLVDAIRFILILFALAMLYFIGKFIREVFEGDKKGDEEDE